MPVSQGRTYFFRVSGLNSSVGDYSLSVENRVDQVPGEAPGATLLFVGNTGTPANLSDQSVNFASDRDWYRLVATTIGEFTINLAQAPGSRLDPILSIYNDQGRHSKTWLRVKQLYCALPPSLRFLVVVPAMVRLWGPTVVRDLVRGNPLRSWNNYAGQGFRGMDPWHDAVDWIGGLPFEVATPEAIFDFYRGKGFALMKMSTCAGGKGCNQFVFHKDASV